MQKMSFFVSVASLKRVISLLIVMLGVFVFADTGFAALTCGDCHGNPPVDNATRDGATGRFPGSHNKHAGVSNLNMACTVCHVNNTTPGHRNGYIEMASPINGDAGASYSKTASFLQTNAAFSGGTCNGVYCHSTVQGVNGTGAGIDKPQTWGTAGPLGCSACHADMSGASATGSHIKHTNSTAGNYNMPCSNCHPGYTSNSTDDSVHANKTINVTPGAGAYSGGTTPGDNAPAGGYGSCSNAYCHSNGSPYNGINTYSTPSWGGAAACSTCHVVANTYASMTSSVTPSPLSGPHAKHMASDRYGANTSFTCNTCHANTVSNNTTISSVTTHVNGTRDVAWNTAAIGNTPVAYNLTTHLCQNVYCHGNGQSANPTVPAFAWSGTFSTCGECHGNAASPAGLSGSHSGHISGGAACNNCHTATASSNTAIGNYANHVNKSVTLQLDANSAISGATYSGTAAFASPFQKAINSGFGSCTNIKCHSDGTALWSGLTPAGTTPVWGPTSAACNTCHGGMNSAPYTNDYRIATPLYGSVTTQTANAKPNAHAPHTSNSSATLNGTGAETQCKHCHNSTTTNNTAIAGGSTTHANGLYTVGGGTATYASGNDVSAPIAVTMTYTGNTFATGASTCSSVSCHPTGMTTANNTDTTTAWNDKATYACTDCHSVNLTANTTYHHSLSSENYTPNDTTSADYPTAVPDGNYDNTSGGLNGASRKCTMCHVKHNIFSDRTNTNAALTAPRAMNLRTSIAQTPSQSANFTNTDYVQGQGANAGVCVSCHNASRTKDTLRQAQVAGVTKTLPVTDAQFTASAHNYEVNRAMKTVGTSNFRANCSKCHTGDNTEAGVTFESSTPNVATHDTVQRRLLAPLGSTAGDPLEEKICYRCHSRATTDVNPGGGPNKSTANRDYYGIQTMSDNAELIFSMFSKAFTHNIAGSAGVHKTYDNEGASANNGSLSGANRHAECDDCHNAHAAGAVATGAYAGTLSAYAAGAPDTLTDGAKSWTVNSLVGYTVRIVKGTGKGLQSVIYRNSATTLNAEFPSALDTTSQYIVYQMGTKDGNKISGTQLGAWSVMPTTWPSQPAAPNWNDSAGVATDPVPVGGQFTSITAWTVTPGSTGATIQGATCLKCHSYYAYGATPPSSPSGLPNSSTTTWSNTIGGTLTQADKGNDFNPNNLGYHPLFSPGKNQPITPTGDTAGTASYYNANWPKFTTGTVSITTAGAATFSSAIPKSTLVGWYLYAGGTAPAQGATTGWYQITALTDDTHVTVTPNPATSKSGVAFMLTAGLGNTFVPPWGPWSTMQCTDCHQSDTATDPMGPHGSATKYLLTRAVNQSFLALNATGVDTAYSTSATDQYSFCQNCHRKDVYGEYNVMPTIANYSRQSHPADSSNQSSMTRRPKWGVVCMNCHGGARTGGIHGENLGRGFNGTAASYSGKRLLGGSTWYGVTRSTTAVAGSCWTKGSADNVDNCSHTHSGTAFQSGVANYTYDANP